jgi:uncharacterized repeat protein (TIGR03806 family)
MKLRLFATSRGTASIISKMVLAACFAGAGVSPAAQATDWAPYGLTARHAAQAYLNMPDSSKGRIPLLLSQTGAFSDVRTLTPSEGLIPYELVVPFWSDGAGKSRWIAVPSGKIGFSRTGEWRFPKGTVFVKTFELPTDEGNPGIRRRLETRLLVCDAAGGVYGVVYKWRADGSDAELLSDSLSEGIALTSRLGQNHEQTWYYPSRKDCLSCHNTLAGGVLGVKTRQLNRDLRYPSGVTDNQLRAWNHLGLFAPRLTDADLAAAGSLAASADVSRSVEDRARSYLDANCSQCHRPGGTVAYFDARYVTPLDRQQLINGPVLIDEGIDHPRVIAAHDIWRSIAYMRIDTVDDIRMPPVARQTIDQRGVALLGQWIESLPGRDVLAPPAMTPAGGTFTDPIEVSLQASEAGAEIHYTVDGSEPGPKDALYRTPIRLTSATVLRARAYKDGFTRSIVAQDVFVVGK